MTTTDRSLFRLQNICTAITDALILTERGLDADYNIDQARRHLIDWLLSARLNPANTSDMTFDHLSVDQLLHQALSTTALADGEPETSSRYFYVSLALAYLTAARLKAPVN